MTDRGSDSLGRREQQILNELETDLRAAEPRLAKLLEHPSRLQRLRYAVRLRRSAMWAAAAIGVGGLLLGLITRYVPVAFAGFVVVLVATSGLLRSRSVSQTFAAIADWFGQTSTPTS